MVDALAEEGDEGRGKLRKAPASRKQALSTGDVRMGKPTLVKPAYGPLNP